MKNNTIWIIIALIAIITSIITVRKNSKTPDERLEAWRKQPGYSIGKSELSVELANWNRDRAELDLDSAQQTDNYDSLMYFRGKINARKEIFDHIYTLHNKLIKDEQSK